MTAMLSARLPRHKPGLTVLLGAGFSQSLQIPGTKAISRVVDTALEARFGSTFLQLRDRLVARFGDDSYNFEVVAAALEACEPFGKPGYMPEAKYLSVIPEVSNIRPDLSVDVARSMYEVLISTVLRMVSVNWKASAPHDMQAAMQAFYDRLRVDHRLDIATLNYDAGVEEFVHDAVDGFVGTGEYFEFDSAAFLANDDRPRVAHVHGSIRYGITEMESKFVKWTGPVNERLIPLWAPRLDGSYYTGMVTGADKPNKLALPPYSVYFAWLGIRLLTSSRMVISGYGIGDVHVNVWLANAARHHAGADFRLVIIDRFDEDNPPDAVMEFFAYGAGFENGIASEPALRALKYSDGIATHGAAMLVRTGMPLTASRLETVADFLRPA